MTQEEIFTLVKAERRRQDRKFGAYSIAGDILLDTKLRIMVEEVGEVARAIDVLADRESRESSTKALIRDAGEQLRDELVQVAACAVGMLESM